MTLHAYMSDEHKACDITFSEAERAAMDGDVRRTAECWGRFSRQTLAHFDNEEAILFPAFEQQTGMTMGPTAVMRSEHEQMRYLMKRMDELLEEGDTEEFLGMAETFMILLQQHNMKEEQMLYRLCDQVLPDPDAMIASMTSCRSLPC